MLIISRQLVKEISYHGEQAYPEECCGVLYGTSEDGVSIVREIGPISNSQGENRERRFLITPQQYLEAERHARERNVELLGFYHSHPEHPAAPSTFDLEQALPWFIYVIVSVMGGRSTGVPTVWRLNDNRSRFDQLTVLMDE